MTSTPAPRRKYPRTFHLPDSPGASDDDRVLADLSGLTGNLVVTEKMDGGNVTFTRHAMYARSVDSGTQAWDCACKAVWGRVTHDIPAGWRVSGESMWARRSIGYRDLPGAYLVFGVWDATHTLLGWNDTVEWAGLLGLPLVPVLYRGGGRPDRGPIGLVPAARRGTLRGVRGPRRRTGPGGRVRPPGGQMGTRWSRPYQRSLAAPGRLPGQRVPRRRLSSRLPPLLSPCASSCRSSPYFLILVLPK